MFKIEQAMKQYQLRIEEYEKQIEYFENEGRLSSLIKKVAFLEKQEKKLLTHLDNKGDTIKMLKDEIAVQKQ
jgi:hypothetical protein